MKWQYRSSISFSVAPLPCCSRQRRDTSGNCSNVRRWSFLCSPIGRRASSNVISTPRPANVRTNGTSGARLPWSTVVPAQSKITRRTLADWHDTGCFQIGAEVFQRRRGQSWNLGLFIETSQGDRGLVIRMIAERSHILLCEGAALQLQASQRCLGEQAKIGRIGGAQKTLGRHMQADRLRDIRAEVARKPVLRS